MADDSGLEVAALNGMPGVLSARWSGNHGDDMGNTALLLAQLRDVPDGRRGAAFVSACALVTASDEVVVRGSGRAPLPGNHAATAGSATTRSSLLSARIAPRRSSVLRRRTLSHRGLALALLVPALRALA